MSGNQQDAIMSDSNFSRYKHSYEINIDFGNAEWANIVKNTLEVDKELRPSLIIRKMEVENSTLKVTFHSTELRMLRTSVSSFFDMAKLVTQTINEFSET